MSAFAVEVDLPCGRVESRLDGAVGEQRPDEVVAADVLAVTLGSREGVLQVRGGCRHVLQRRALVDSAPRPRRDPGVLAGVAEGAEPRLAAVGLRRGRLPFAGELDGVGQFLPHRGVRHVVGGEWGRHLAEQVDGPLAVGVDQPFVGVDHHDRVRCRHRARGDVPDLGRRDGRFGPLDEALQVATPGECGSPARE